MVSSNADDEGVSFLIANIEKDEKQGKYKIASYSSDIDFVPNRFFYRNADLSFMGVDR